MRLTRAAGAAAHASFSRFSNTSYCVLLAASCGAAWHAALRGTDSKEPSRQADV
jgi:hypothetical protein